MYPTTDLSTITSLRDAFNANVTTLAVFLSLNRLNTAHIEYSGSGDSGDYEASTFTSVDGSEVRLRGDIKLTYISHRDPNAWNNTPSAPEAKSYDPASFVSMLLDQAISVSNHDGYENNDGGGGELTVNADGTWKHSHYDNIVNQEYDENEGDFTEVVASHIEAARRAAEAAANAGCDPIAPITDQPYAVFV
jgi:hypothetical protein